MLTGKRTLFVIPFFTTILFVLVNKIKGKYIKILFAGCIVLLLFYIFIMIIPQAGIILTDCLIQKAMLYRAEMYCGTLAKV